MDLMELMGVSWAWAPSDRFTAAVSCRSFCRVPEPCALTSPHQPGPGRAAPGLLQRAVDGPGHLQPLTGQTRHVVGVAEGGVAADLAEDLRAPGPGVLVLLEDEHRRALAHDEPVAAGVEGPGGVLGVVVVRRRRLDGVEARHGDRRYGGVGRPRDAHVGAALGDGVEAVADRVEP